MSETSLTDRRCGTCRWWDEVLTVAGNKPSGWGFCLWMPDPRPPWFTAKVVATQGCDAQDGTDCPTWQAKEANATCQTCGGHRRIGGYVGGAAPGYEDHPCPDCQEAKEASGG